MLNADLTADALLAVVRVHADRVHDAVRRWGCAPAEAVEVVETSALDLVDTVAGQPEAVGDPVGWWFARARALARTAAGTGADELPMGGGILGGDANQLRLAEALEARPERERAALLLRDSYDLPAAAVGTALGLDADAAMEAVGAARLAFLPTLLGGTPLSLTNHSVDLAALARLAEGHQPSARDATTRRHVQSCTRCGDALDAQERARRLLSGLTVVALPDAEREEVLARVEQRGLALLQESEPEEWDDDEPRRRYSLSLMALGVLVATGLGIAIAIALSRGGTVTPAEAIADLPLITPAPVLTLAPGPTASPVPPSVSPSPRVFLITPSPTPVPTATATPTATPTIAQEPLSLELTPSSGPNNTEITVNGRGWTPGNFVTVDYLQQVGGTPGSSATVLIDVRGRFTTTLTARDPQGLPGAHDVVADDGDHRERATFTATS